MKRYKCKECGYIHIGDSAPSVCPVCGYDSSVFELMEDSSENEKIEFYEMIDSLDDTSIRTLRQLFDLCSEQASVSNAMSKQALKEGRKDLHKSFSKKSKELLEFSSFVAMMLGEFLELSSDDNLDVLNDKLKKIDTKTDLLIDSLKSDDDYKVYVELMEKYKKLINNSK